MTYKVGGLCVVTEPALQGPVDLETVERQAPQVAQARISGAEIVNRNPHTELTELAKRFYRLLGIFHDGAFRQLELEVARFQSRLVQSRADDIDQSRLFELSGGEVDRNPERAQARCLPREGLSTSLA